MRNKITTFILSLFLIMVFASSQTIISKANNDNVPIEINSIEDMYNVRDDITADYILMRDLDFNDETSYDDPNTTIYGDINLDKKIEGIKDELTTEGGWPAIDGYSGVFDGNGHVLRNLYINNRSFSSLFSMLKGDFVATTGVTVNKYAEVKNLGLENVDITGYMYASAIVTQSYAGKISNVYVKGEVKCYGSSANGIANELHLKSIVENSYVEGDVIGLGERSMAAGIAALVTSAKIANNYITASVYGEVMVTGIATEIGIGSIIRNNIVFSDYIGGNYSVFRQRVYSYSPDNNSTFVRRDTRITTKRSNGDTIATYPVDIENDDKYPVTELDIYSLFEGLYLTYEDFKDPNFYTKKGGYEIQVGEKNETGGFIEECFKGMCPANTPDGDFNQVTLWDFDNTWEILDGASRPTLKVFNKDNNAKDYGYLSLAPIPGSDLTVNGTAFKGGDTIILSWNEAFPVNSPRVYYDLYYSDGTSSTNVEDLTLLTYSDGTAKDVSGLKVLDGRTTFEFSAPYDIDSSDIRFYVVAHNRKDSSKIIFSNVITIDNEYPEVSAIIDKDTEVANGETTNKDFTIKLKDASNLTKSYTFNGENKGRFKESDVFTEAGVYEFTVVDQMGNSSQFKITINKTIPDLSISDIDGTEVKEFYVTNKDVKPNVNGSDLVLTYSLNGKDMGNWTNNDVFSSDGLYIFSAVDSYGNGKNYQVIIDKKEAEAVKIPSTTKSDTIEVSFDELISAISMDNGKTWEKVDSTDVSIELKKGVNTFLFKDTAGTVSKYSIKQGGNTLLTVSIISGVLILCSSVSIGYFVFNKK